MDKLMDEVKLEVESQKREKVKTIAVELMKRRDFCQTKLDMLSKLSLDEAHTAALEMNFLHS